LILFRYKRLGRESKKYDAGIAEKGPGITQAIASKIITCPTPKVNSPTKAITYEKIITINEQKRKWKIKPSELIALDETGFKKTFL
jgi:hypothetical protein